MEFSKLKSQLQFVAHKAEWSTESEFKSVLRNNSVKGFLYKGDFEDG